MLGLIIPLIIVGVLLIIVFFVLYYLYRRIFYSPLKGQNEAMQVDGNPLYEGYEDQVKELITNVQKIPYEDTYIYSKDKKKLHARIYKGTTDKVAILCHGYRGSPYRDFSGGTISLTKMGINVLLIDERAHCDSEGHTITFGHKEKEDIVLWLKKAKEIFGEDKKYTLVGISMGGASVLMASKYVDSNIKIIADSPYNTTREILEIAIKMVNLSPKLLYPLVRLSALIFAHFDPSKESASEAVKKSHSKILIIHGDSDHIVPQTLSKQIYLENKEKVQYESFPNTDHGMGYITDNKRYLSLIKNFINE